MLLSDKTYDKAKRVVQIILPASATLYFTIASIWGLPAVEEVLGTISAIAAFGGAVLGISTHQYNKDDGRFDGAIIVKESDGRKIFSLELDQDPEELESMDQVSFQVRNLRG